MSPRALVLLLKIGSLDPFKVNSSVCAESAKRKIAVLVAALLDSRRPGSVVVGAPVGGNAWAGGAATMRAKAARNNPVKIFAVFIADT